MKTAFPALALLLAAALPLRAEEGGTRGSASHGSAATASQVSVDTGLALFDIFLNTAALGMQAAAIDAAAPPPREPTYGQRARDDAWSPYRQRQMQARQGLLLSFGLGGGSAYLSNQGPGRTGAFDLDFRLGYGFSDRFQLFMDFAVDAGRYPQSSDFASWMFTIRGQTVLVGDRAGNGLNLNLGIGVGGVDYSNGYYSTYSSSSGLALAGGLSYDARVTPWFSLSPELFVNWHQIPNRAGLPDDISSTYGLRLNFLWYLK
ncbi:MAG TPA: hypothetical protein VFA79_13565 [Myxococcales bacterium]|nr:hypothetical protein [Myxococcales bacterium]